MATRDDSTPPDQILDELATVQFDAIFSEDDVRAQEAEYNETWGARRRMMLITLARSRTELLNGFGATEDGADTALDLAETLQDYKKHLEAGVELAETARTRLLCIAAAVSEGTAT